MDDFATGYAMGQDSNGNGHSDGMWGGDGWWAIIIFAMIFGWGGNGWGNRGTDGALTRSDLASEFGINDLQNGIRGVQNGLCDGFYSVNTSLLNGFNQLQNTNNQGFAGLNNVITANANGLQNSMNQGFAGLNTELANGFNQQTITALQGQNALQAQLCSNNCETREEIAQVRYDMATGNCALQTSIANAARDITDNANANYRALIDYLTQDKIATLQSENQNLRFAASQAAQNAILTNAMTEQTAQIVSRVAPYPIPAYQVSNPQAGVGCCGTCGSY